MTHITSKSSARKIEKKTWIFIVWKSGIRRWSSSFLRIHITCPKSSFSDELLKGSKSDVTMVTVRLFPAYSNKFYMTSTASKDACFGNISFLVTVTLFYCYFIYMVLCARIYKKMNRWDCEIFGFSDFRVWICYLRTRNACKFRAILQEHIGAIASYGSVKLWTKSWGLSEAPLTATGPSTIIHQRCVYCLAHYRIRFNACIECSAINLYIYEIYLRHSVLFLGINKSYCQTKVAE